jgi:protein-disulfide isomerase
MKLTTAIIVVLLSLSTGTLVGRVFMRPPPAPPSLGTERIYVPLGGWSQGPADAPVKVVTFIDFQCAPCAQLKGVLEKIRHEFGSDVQLFVRHYPRPFHADAPLAAHASLAAGEQGKFWEYYGRLLDNQKELQRPALDKHARELGLDLERFAGDLDRGRFVDAVKADMDLGRALGVSTTPTTYVNGRPLRGSPRHETIQRLVREELNQAHAAMARGVSRAAVYAALFANEGSPDHSPVPGQKAATQ